jgi:hypothetical protein
MRRVMGMVMFLMLIGPAPAAPGLASHPLHTTYSEMEWNPESRRFEVALQLPGFVIDEELSLIHRRRINVETAADAEKLVEEYVRSRFKVTTDSLQECRLHWVGMEVELRDVWVYFEVEPVRKSDVKKADDVKSDVSEALASVESSAVVSDSKTQAAFGSKGKELIPDESALVGLKVRNSLLIDGRPDQVNLVNVTIHRRLSSLNLTAEQPEAKVSRLQKARD